MKWPCSGGGVVASGSGGTITEPVDVVGVTGNGSSQLQQRSQDDAAVGYVFQRPPDPEFPPYGPKQARWALGDDSIIDNHDKWKFTIPSKMTQDIGQMGGLSHHGMNAGVTYDLSATAALQQAVGVGGLKQQQPTGSMGNGTSGAEQMVFMQHHGGLQPLGLQAHHHAAAQHYIQNCMPQQMQPQQSQPMQIAPAAKKLWGLEGGVGGVKDAGVGSGKGLTLHHLHHHEQVWRDSTWSTTDHAVSQPITMVSRRAGSFPAGGGVDSSNILSPRGSDSTGGLGVKMVEYVLGSSPTSKDSSLGSIEPRMRGLSLNDATSGSVSGSVDKEGKEKASPSPFDKDSMQKENGGVVVMQNGGGVVTSGGVPMQNGVVQVLDEEKGFNRTPGSRQPSPAEEELSKNLQYSQVVILKQGGPVGVEHEALVAAPGHQPSLAPLQLHAQTHHALNVTHPSQHPGLTLADSVNQHFEHVLSLDQVSGVQSGVGPYEPVPYSQAPQHQQPQTDANATLLQQQQNFDVQQLFRSQQQTQAQTLSQPTQLQLLQQQQYLAAAAAQQAAAPPPAAAFAQPPYVLNPAQHGADAAAAAAAPYVPATLITPGVPQYYGVTPWVYPANIIPQSSNAPRRPLSPSSQESAAAAATTALQGGYIVPYYDTNGQLLVAQSAAMRNGAPMRLVSPAPVLVQQQASRQAQTTASLYSGTANLYGTNVNTSAVNGGSLGGLGINTGSTGRRDSFDRNTSAFSPSLEYRQKWSASYGLGSSPGPLTNSLSPPPTAPIQLGGLVNSRVISAAPGAEAKYRNTVATGLTNNAMFGSTSSLFTKLNSTRPNLTNVTQTTLDKPAGRSRLLEDFRNNRFPNLQLRDLANHIVEFSQDQHGSRFIQQKLERATVPEKQLVFNEILSAAYNLMTDVFGNYVIQKFFEFGTSEQKTTLAQKVRGHVLQLALQMYGCRVIQKALESIPAEHQQEIVRELDGHVLKCVKDQNGNHVVQKCIECVEPSALQFIIKSFGGQVFALSTHPYGCRVIQRVLEHCTPEQTAPLLAELHTHTDQLIQDQFGNYVIQHVLEHGKPEDKSQLIAGVRGKVLALSQHKFASNVVEKCVTHATRAERALLIEEVCGFNDNALHVMMKDQYANYVVQKMIDVSEPTQRKVLMHKIRPHLNSLRKYTYGKHIIAKLEKFFMKTASAMGALGGNELGPIGPPSNGVM